MRAILSLFVVLLFVTACGGGEVSVVPPVDDPEVVEEPEVEEPEVEEPEVEEPEPKERFDCFETDEATLSAFLEDLNTPLSESDKAAYREFLESLGAPVPEIRDQDRERLGDLTDVLCDGRVNRWGQAPVIRIGASPKYEREELLKIIAQMNKSLPDEFDIRFGEGVSPNSSERPPNGEIWVDISPEGYFIGYDGIRRDGWASFSPTHPVQWGKARSTIAPEGVNGTQRIETIVHELWHVLLGHHCHASAGVIINGNFKWKIFTAGTTDNQDKITRLELDALRALYLHMEPGDHADSLRIPEEEMCGN